MASIIKEIVDLGEGGSTPPTDQEPIYQDPQPQIGDVGIVGPEGEVIYQPVPIIDEQSEQVIVEIPQEIIEAIEVVSPGFTLPTVDDVIATLPQDLIDAYNRMEPKDLELFRDALEEYLLSQPDIQAIIDYAQLIKSVIDETNLAIAITTESFQDLDLLQQMLRDVYSNNTPIQGYTMDSYIPTMFLKNNPDATLNDLKIYLRAQIDATGLVPTRSSSLWDPSLNIPFALWYSLQDFTKHNRTTVGPNQAQAEAQLAYAERLYRLLITTSSYGYNTFNINDFVRIADRLDLIYEAGALYGNAILKSLEQAFLAHPNDDEAALSAFLLSFAKLSPDLGKLFQLLDTHSPTTDVLFNLVAEGMFNFIETKYKRTYLGEGGMRPAITPMYIIGEIMISVLSQPTVSVNYLDRVLNVWPYKSADGVAFIPTVNGVYFYEPGAVGTNLKYYANDYSGGVNASLFIASKLAKAKIPYVSVVAGLIGSGAKLYSLADSYKYASKANVSTAGTYQNLPSTITQFTKEYLLNWLADNPEAPQQVIDYVEGKVDDVIDTFHPKPEPETPSTPLLASVLTSTRGTKPKEEVPPVSEPARPGGAFRTKPSK